jgi:hypothetical protein
MRKCWQANSEDRPSFAILLEHLKKLVGDDYSDAVD